MSSRQPGEGEIRKGIVEADLLDCMIALPGQLFYTTTISACLWFLSRNKNDGRFRGRRCESLFIDARSMGTIVDRTHRELSTGAIQSITSTYHAWRGETDKYRDVPGFCKRVSTDEIVSHDYSLSPGRYIDSALQCDEDVDFNDRMQELCQQYSSQVAESRRLESELQSCLKRLGFHV